MHPGPVTLTIGASLVLREGRDVALLATGNMLATAVRVADLLAPRGLACRVVSMPTVKPLDTAAIDAAIATGGVLATLEEHSLIGGVGAAVAEHVAEQGRAVRFRRFAAPDRFSHTCGDRVPSRRMRPRRLGDRRRRGAARRGQRANMSSSSTPSAPLALSSRPARPARPRLSAVIACYKDGLAIPHMYERLTRALAAESVDLELIFVNDGSPDDSETVLAGLAAADPRVVAITHTRNFGSQAAFTSGMQICTGDMVVLMDGDLQDPPELIPQFLAKWREGYDVVYGIRVKREATRFLQLAYKAFYRVFHALSYIEVPRDAGDFSLMDRRVIAAVNSLDERDRFLRGLRAWVGFRQIGVPYERPERMFGVTTNNLRKNIAWARKGIFSFSFVPLEIIFYLALGVSALKPIHVGGQNLSAGAMLQFSNEVLMGSLQFLCLAVIGDYVGRVLEEVKNRPHYLVASVLNDPRTRAGTTLPSAAAPERP